MPARAVPFAGTTLATLRCPRQSRRWGGEESRLRTPSERPRRPRASLVVANPAALVSDLCDVGLLGYGLCRSGLREVVTHGRDCPGLGRVEHLLTQWRAVLLLEGFHIGAQQRLVHMGGELAGR